MMLIPQEQAVAQRLIPSTTDLVPAIPDAKGFAGMYAGFVGDELIAAGGANFPDKMPWEGGKKIWHDVIFVYSKQAGSWSQLPLKLPKKLAYGITVSYKNGLLLFGGSEQDNIPSAAVYYLKKEGQSWQIEQLSQSPEALVNMCGSRVGDHVILATGSSDLAGTPASKVFCYDLKKNSWHQLPDLPGQARINAVSATSKDSFYVFSGIALHNDAQGKTIRTMLTDAYQLDFGEKPYSWKKLQDLPIALAAGPLQAANLNDQQFIFFGGLDQQTAQYADPATHPGFRPEVWAYSIAKNQWREAGVLPKKEMRLTLPSVQHKNMYYLINGEVGPGVRSNSILSIDLNNLK